MTERILIPIDYGSLSKKALRRALSDFPDAEFTALHVIDFRSSDLGPGGFGSSETAWDDWLADAREHAAELLVDAEEIAAEYDADIVTDVVVGEDSRSIIDYAAEHDIDMIVMGSHGRSLSARVLLGRVSTSVVRRASVPVMIVR